MDYYIYIFIYIYFWRVGIIMSKLKNKLMHHNKIYIIIISTHISVRYDRRLFQLL